MTITKNTSFFIRHKRVCILLLVLLSGVIACVGLFTMASDTVQLNPEVDTRPKVSARTISPIDYQTTLRLSGVFKPAEQTDIAFELSGKVASLHPNFVVGGIVKQGDLLATLDPFDYKTQVLEKQASFALAQAHLSEELAKAEVAKKEWANRAHIPALALREPQVASARAQLKAAKASLSLAEKNLSRTQYFAPYDALIAARSIGLGQVISKGEMLGQIVNLSYGEIHIPIAGFEQPFIPALPANNVQVHSDNVQRQGILTRHTGQFNDVTRMAYYIVKVDDPYALNSQEAPLYFGQFLAVNIPGKILKNVIKVPQEWIKNQTLWLLNTDGTLVKNSVTVVREEYGFALLNAPTGINHQIVTQLPEYPQSGMQVKRWPHDTQLAERGDKQ
ncbi:efflux RND transporter periplasmic adaptor subunit [Pseudoalteromonas aurantia]|uniref:Efflux RND transporter periplasmic adaptor subunit n=1 Tax=Pseudoalteromonas aurantia TaxID=43654 RepID=A0A5S3V4U3_9GAMM|nr:efflux RND transporter periplasmic adaptor subunit [Pseudoalteromonas aurantia]TMO61373.1 efflux RND transporter periplasmic adaptor subunit [Pseudoalteromonas aurantia]TMO65832.1 efflux RND transporter periplasmic adaptor subunit [Pseudoalteromonas aurantia]TMO72235.1 efflux RND transporter periplasmic adaptor subunit [Pseudoalteromonas aurantia]